MIEFLLTDYKFDDIVLKQVKIIAVFIAKAIFRLSLVKFITRIIIERSRSHFIESRFWLAEWAIDKTAFREAIRRFEQIIRIVDDSSNDFSNNFILSSSDSSSDSSFIEDSSNRSQNRKRSTASLSHFFDTTEEVDKEKTSITMTQLSQKAWQQIKRDINQIVQAAMRNMSERSSELSKSSDSFDTNEVNNNDNDESLSTIKFAENIDYFDLEYLNSANNNFFIVIAKRHIFYRDVFIFIDRLKYLVKDSVDETRLRELLSDIFRDVNLKWYDTELILNEKNLFNEIFIDT